MYINRIFNYDNLAGLDEIMEKVTNERRGPLK